MTARREETIADAEPWTCAVLAAAAIFPPTGQPLPALAEAAPAQRNPLQRMDRLCGLSLLAVERALGGSDRWRGSAGWQPERIGVIVGSAHGCHKTDEDYYRGVLAGEPSPRLFAYTLPSSPVGELSIRYGLLGPGLAVVSGGTAGLEALWEAQALLRSGQVDACLVLAAEVAEPALTGESLRDGAVALLVAAPGSPLAALSNSEAATVPAVATAFASGEPRRALALALDRAFAAAAIAPDALDAVACDAVTRGLLAERSDLARARWLEPGTPPCGAVDALHGLVELAQAGSRHGLVACVTPSGLAACAVRLARG